MKWLLESYYFFFCWNNNSKINFLKQEKSFLDQKFETMHSKVSMMEYLFLNFLVKFFFNN